MKLKKCNQLLQEYKNQLNGISINDADYKILLGITVSNFFYEIKKIDSNFLEYYFNNINEENIFKNKVQKDAFNYLFLLLIKNMNNPEIIDKFFPEYLESDSIIKSNWRVIRWLQTFIAWLFKPKFKLNGLPDAINLLNSLRDIKYRLENTKTDLLDINLETEKYKSLTFIIEKFLKNKALPVIYTPINENNLLEKWDLSSHKNVLREEASAFSKECSEMDTLIKYLNNRIQLLLTFDERVKIAKDFVSLKSAIFKKEISLFDEKSFEIKKFIKDIYINNKNINNKNLVQIRGIYNLIEGIQQRLKRVCRVNLDSENRNLNQLSDEFKQLLNLSISKMQFYYVSFRQNLDKQYELCYGIFDTYNALDELDRILFTDPDLFLYSINHAAYNAYLENLPITLDKLQLLANALENISKKLDPKFLEDDILKLSQFISTEISNIRRKFEEKYVANNPAGRDIFDVEIAGSENDNYWETEWEIESILSETFDDVSLPEREPGDGESERCSALNLSLNLLERGQGDGRAESNYPANVLNQPSNVSGVSFKSPLFFRKNENDSYAQPIQNRSGTVQPGLIS